MKTIFKLTLIFFAITVGAAPSFSGTSCPTIDTKNYSFFDAKAVNANKKTNKKRGTFFSLLFGSQSESSKRSLASTTKLSDEAVRLRDELLQATDAHAIHRLIETYETKYSTLPEDAKFLSIMLSSLKPFRGILYKVKEFVSQHKMAHSNILTTFKAVAANIKLLFPDNTHHLPALFEYVAAPYRVNGKLVRQVSNEADIQNWLFCVVGGNMLQTLEKLSGLQLKKPITWDNTVVYGRDSYLDNINRYKLFDKIEREVFVASLEAGLGQIYFSKSYSAKNAGDFSSEIGKKLGVNVILSFGKVNGLTPKDVVKVLNKKKFNEFGKKVSCQVMSGEACTVAAYSLAKSSVERLDAVWDDFRAYRNSSQNQFFLDSSFFSKNFNDENIRKIKTFFSEDFVAIRSSITGEVIEVSVKNFYMNPPQDLKALMPTSFEIQKYRFISAQKGREDKYRNYFYGRPTAWNAKAYEAYFRSGQSGEALSPKKIGMISRIMSHAFGGSAKLDL